jgi:diguanylate cyclase (GGDEF)-like protein
MIRMVMRQQSEPPAESPSLATKLLLQSRFGQRLLGLFVVCAVVPTCAVAWLSYQSTASQLTQQSWERLASTAGSAGHVLFDRLDLLEADMRKSGSRLSTCSECTSSILYAADEVVWVSAKATRRLGGEADDLPTLTLAELPELGPGQSTVFARRQGADALRIYLAHRPGASPDQVVTRINPSYLWSDTDDEALPSSVSMTLWDPVIGVLVASASGGAEITPGIAGLLGGAPSGTFVWNGSRGESLGSWWAPAATDRSFHTPVRVIMSEPMNEVLAPMASFQRDFPLLLAASLFAVLLLCMGLIRRSLQPLAELQRGTRRIAERDFEHRVVVSSGDELEELAGSFNTMSTRLARQFNALKAAAEIDRAVLSSVDAGSIAQAVVDRVPDMCPCDGLSITLLAAPESVEAITWRGSAGGMERSHQRTRLDPEDLRRAQQHPDGLVYATGGAALPAFLNHFQREGDATEVEVFPLRFTGDLLGVLALRRKPGETTEDDMVQVRRIADQIAVALANARMVDQVRFLAFYDSLTKLPNRVLYRERLAQALVRAARTDRFVAVCFIDLDHFSRINDTLGHDLGDELLQEVARRLTGSARTGDSVARLGVQPSGAEVSRLGGDEFTVVLSDLTDPQESVRVARRLLESLRCPIRLGTQEVFVTASVGIAIYPFDGTDTEELLKSADVAMYHAKEQGRNTYQMYSASMNAEAMTRLQLEQQLRRAVEAREFTVWYQPIVDLDTRRPVGAEALVRWEHPERGMVSPAEFISLCEESGLIVPLGEWILREVCTQAKAWEVAGLGPVRMSVNLSARQLRHDGIVEMVRAILQDTGVRPRSLVLELTESMLMEPKGVTGRTILELANLGVSLAIDDFGTGYSSLSYLKNFPVTALKIDRSFIAGITADPDDAAITTAIIALARAMELDVVAEGVETEAQAEFLKDRGCQKIQGYLVGRPMGREAFEAELRAAVSQQPSAASRKRSKAAS